MKKIVPVLCLALLSACGESSQNNGGQANAQPDVKPIALGQTGKADGVDITITSAKATSQLGPAGVGPKAEAGEVFVVVRYTLKNTSTKPLGMMEKPGLTLVDGEGNSYASDDTLGAMDLATSPDAANVSLEINPGTSTKWAGGWKVAKAGFDKATWKVVANTDPALTFALK